MATKRSKRLPPIHPGEILQDLLSEAAYRPMRWPRRCACRRIGSVGS